MKLQSLTAMQSCFLCLLLFAGCAKAAPGKKERAFALPDIKKDCSICHISHEMKVSPLLNKPVNELCLGCHPERKAPAEHAVDVIPSMKVKGLPLFDGKIACATCHDPHKNKFGSLLRVKPKDLCLACHKY